ncbi:nuclear transport factor 2 family protein [Phreatobacter aquaticus]|uniref:Nuclear transport factor 2 family protein n=1 Tax=Phreatobacter aquaticus TaxID=2570229 RepID=A0A4D7QK29_9HYPH|nr:nuclear transport factor 2 family protein [Phreatobacter aquaticus]QCK88040.1 nuclear transport factor 2 family protein [Phreatobacter aquaticus]
MSIALVTADLPVHQLLKVGYAAWARGDMRPLLAMAAPACELTIAGNPALNAGTGTWIGPAAIVQAFAQIRSALILRDMTIESMLVDETRAFVHRHAVHEVISTGRTHETQFVDVLDLRREQITRVQIFYDTATMALMMGQVRVATVTTTGASDPKSSLGG